MKRHWLGASVLAALLTPAVAFGFEYEAPRSLEASPPRYPPEAARAGAAGTAVLVITVAASGEIEDVQVEKSSGHPLLDTAAIEAARTWKFSPAREAGQAVAGRVRMPVDFNMGEADEMYHPFLARMDAADHVPPVPVDEKGRVPGYIRDPLPIEVGSVEEAIAMLSARGELAEVQGAPPGLSIYSLAAGKEYSQWQVYREGFAHAPSLVRRRLVSDGGHGFFVTRTLCESANTSACAGLQLHQQNTPPQKAISMPKRDDGDKAPMK